MYKIGNCIKAIRWRGKNMKYSKLQNGSDIRGIAVVVENEKVNLGEKEAVLIGIGFGKWLKKKGFEKGLVAIGRDSRITGENLSEKISLGIEAEGFETLNTGLSSTPAMFMSTKFEEFNCVGSVMVTASHLPYNRNGFKFFIGDGGLDKQDIKDILIYGEESEEKALEMLKNQSKSYIANKRLDLNAEITLMDRYSQFLGDIIKNDVNAENYDKPLNGLKIVVDAGNGAGGFYAKKVLEPLGADISCSQFLEPDGMFPNHVPNPEDKKAMASISEKVMESKADLGLIFDTDVDRAGAVDRLGREISRNGIIAMAAALISAKYKGSTVVTDSITSNQLTDFLEHHLGLKHKRFKRGYKNVINEAKRLNEEGIDCHLAIETSGHGAVKENFFLDDGAYLATKIVIAAAKLKKKNLGIEEMIKDLKMPVEEKEIRLKLHSDNFGEIGDKILADLEQWAGMKPCARRNEQGDIVAVPDGGCNLCHCGMSVVKPNYEGVRINFDKENGNGWCLVRKSLHDPILPINIESEEKGGVEKIWEKIKPFLSYYKELDLS